MERLRPPEDITPLDFFSRWLPASVERDGERGDQIAKTEATLVFVLEGDGGGTFTLEISGGQLRGSAGKPDSQDLEIRVDVATWRSLNSGTLSAPEAVVRRRLKLSGDLLLALKLHLILG